MTIIINHITCDISMQHMCYAWAINEILSNLVTTTGSVLLKYRHLISVVLLSMAVAYSYLSKDESGFQCIKCNICEQFIC